MSNELPKSFKEGIATRRIVRDGKEILVQDYRNPLAPQAQSRLDKTMRKCLRCDSLFPSKSKFNRMCELCRGKETMA